MKKFLLLLLTVFSLNVKAQYKTIITVDDSVCTVITKDSLAIELLSKPWTYTSLTYRNCITYQAYYFDCKETLNILDLLHLIDYEIKIKQNKHE